MEYQRDEHRVHLLVYHIVWTPKRRKAVLRNQIAHRCNELIHQKCEEKGWTILNLAIQPDHIHLFIQAWPDNSPSEIVKEIKGITSYHLRREFPELLKLPSMWTRSFFAATAGNVSQEIIQKYIEAQKGV